jgi:hypothetical protein
VSLSCAFLVNHATCFNNACIRWEEPHEDDFHSEEVKILFYALYNTMNQIAAAASPLQNRDVTKELVETVSFRYILATYS